MNYSYLAGFIVCLILITQGAFAATYDTIEDQNMLLNPVWTIAVGDIGAIEGTIKHAGSYSWHSTADYLDTTILNSTAPTNEYTAWVYSGTSAASTFVSLYGESGHSLMIEEFSGNCRYTINEVGITVFGSCPAGAWHKFSFVMNETTSKVTLNVYDNNNALRATTGELSYTYSGNDFNRVRLGNGAGGTDSYFDDILYDYGNTVTADFNYAIDKTTATINLTNTSTYTGSPITDLNWIIGGVHLGDANTYSITSVTALTDYNVCLKAGNSLGTNNQKCLTINSGDWTAPATTFSETKVPNQAIQTVRFSCTDNNSGCKWITYWTDANTTRNIVANTGNKDVNFSGTGKIYYYSTDNSDNNETTKQSQYPGFTYTNVAESSYVSLFGKGIYAGATVTTWSWQVNGTIISTDQNKNYSTQANQDLNVCLTLNSTQYCQSVKTWDTSSPTIDANINPASYGFVSDFDINYAMTCYDNFTPIQYLITWSNGTTNTTIYNSSDANASLKTGTLDLNAGQNATLTFTCTDDSNNTAQYVSPTLYALRFRLINENTGVLFDLNKIIAAQAYSYDGNFIYNFKDANQTQTNFFSPSTTIRFDFTYPDESATKISREINFDYLDDSNVGICVAEYQQFYLYRFLSTSVKPVVVYNDYANCYNLASTTKFLYNTYQANAAYTINKPYYLYTYSNGVKTLLALLDGANNTEINLDILVFNQQEYEYVIDTDVISFNPSDTDYNTIVFLFSSPNDNDSVELQIYNGDTLLWDYTELSDTNRFQVNFYYGDLGVTDSNLLKIVVNVTLDGTTTSFYKWFNTKSESYAGIMNPVVAIVLSFFIMFFGVTMVSYRFAMGWFGLFISLIAIGVLALAPPNEYIIFLQTIYFIIGIFIGIVGKEQTLGVQ